MGQRHQLFVIARVGKHYRSLAVIHHQWLYGVSALRSCLRLLHIFSDPGNRLALQHELDLAAPFFEDKPPLTDRTKYEDAESTICPFPFTLTCLMVGASYDQETGRAQVVHELQYDMGYDQGDNNDGITVLDITHLDNVRYCFVNFYGGDIYYQEDEATKPPPLTPLTGKQYLRGYYDWSNEMVQRNVDIIEELEKAPLVEDVTLARAWPWGEWGDEALAKAAEPLQSAQDGTTKSLRDIAMASMFNRLLTSSDDEFDTSQVDEAQNLPGFQQSAEEYLLSHPEKIGTTKASAYLLSLVYAGKDCLEWNAFTQLNPKTIKAALSSDTLKDATTISLTALRNTKPSELVEALSPLKRLETLQVMDRPDREDESASTGLFEALAGSDHPMALKKVALTGLYANGIRHKIWRCYRDHPKTLDAFPVVQLLVNQQSQLFDPSVPQLEAYYLGDAPLTPTRFVTGFFQYLSALVSYPPVFGGTGLQCAYSFCCGPSNLGDGQCSEITGLPTEAYALGSEAHHSSIYKGLQSRLRDLTPDSWTVVVSGTEHVDQFKYAFVRSKVAIQVNPQDDGKDFNVQPADLEVVDMEEFLRKTAPGVDTGKLAFHVSKLENALAERNAQRQSNHPIPEREGPLLSVLSPDEVCEIVGKFVAAMPDVQKLVSRSGRWEVQQDSWLARLGFDADAQDD